jgi:hypothetical protein
VSISQCASETSPSFKFPNDPSWAPFVTLLTGAGPTYSIPSVIAVPLPAQGVMMTQADVTSNSITLSLSNVTFAFDIEHPDSDPNSQKFRAVMITPDHAPPNVDPSLNLEAFIGLAPLNTTLQPSAKLTIPNPKPGTWQHGARIDVYLNGADGATLNPPAPWGTFTAIGTATVSSDGNTVSTDSGTGNGIPEIAMVAMRLHQ